MSIYQIKDLKDIRSRIILKEMSASQGTRTAYILSCGNAYRSLKNLGEKDGVRVIGLSTTHPYKDSIQLESRFYSKDELAGMFPNMFNATPGALSNNLMWQIGWEIYRKLCLKNYKEGTLYVPVGSGETLKSLSMVIPKENLKGFTCDCYPPIKLDFSFLSEELKEFDIIKINALMDAYNFVSGGSSVMVTW